LVKTLQRYITAVSQYRLYLFTQYTQSDEPYKHKDLLHVRKVILNRFQSVISELEVIVDDLQTHRISISDAQQSIYRSAIKDVYILSQNYFK
jgi:hypothetical protein